MAKELRGGVINLGAKIQRGTAEWMDGRKRRSHRRRGGIFNSATEGNTADPWSSSSKRLLEKDFMKSMT